MQSAHIAARAPGGRGRFVVGNKAAVAVALLGLGLFGALPAMAAKHPWEDYDKRLEASKSVAALGSDLFGDSVSLQDGALSFSSTDVSLPGNSGLPVALGRTYRVFNRKDHGNIGVMGDWAVDLPHITGDFADAWLSHAGDGNRCSDTRGPAVAPSGFNASDYYNGLQLQIPGVGGGELLVRHDATSPRGETTKPTDGKSYPWMTQDQIHVSCLTAIKNGSGQGFLAVTPDGTRYWFDWMAQDVLPTLESAWFDTAGVAVTRLLTPRKTTLYATRVEDRFGNWVTYTYTNVWNQSGTPTTITASDGRQITVGYASGRIASVSNGSHSWQYQYGSTTSGRTTLTDVIRPDGSRWDINFAGFTNAEIRQTEANQMVPGERYRSCKQLEAPIVGTTFNPTGSITHPSGATGTFDLDISLHGLSHVPVSCGNVSDGDTGWFGGNNPNDDTNLFSIEYYAFTLRQKQIAGPGLTPHTWDYAYDRSTDPKWFWAGNATFSYPVCTLGTAACYARKVCDGGPCEGASLTTVTGPNGEWTRYTFGNSFRYNEGKLLRTDRGSSATDILESVVNTYDLSLADQAYPSSFGFSQRGNEYYAASFHRPLVRRDTTRQGETFTWQLETCGSVLCTDEFVNPIRVRKHSTLGFSRTEATTYDYDLARWLIHLPLTTSCMAAVPAHPVCNGDVMAQTDYDAAKLPLRHYTFDKLQHTLTYYADGTLATYKDGRNNVTTLSSWYRGVPRSIVYPDTTGVAATVNSDGTIASATDENGHKTCYAYDPMGRLASITWPSESASGVCNTVDWNPTTQAFVPVGTSEYGIAAGHWRQTVQTGNGVRISYLDALWRPLLTREYDAADVVGTQRFVRREFDHAGRTSFESYPGIGASPIAGTRSTYDTLGRLTRVEQDSELGMLVTTTQYDPDAFTVKVTNPRLHSTQTLAFMAWDAPTMDFPLATTHPEGAFTDIVRDPYGNPKSVTRRNSSGSVGATRTYAYDRYKQLCRTVEPETGATLLGYDLAGNLSWSASGLPAATACDLEGDTATILARKALRTYDARNRLTALSFPDGLGDTETTYTPDGLPATITAYNGYNHTLAVVNAYVYNARRQLAGQGESIHQEGWYTWGYGYGYNANGHLATNTYVSGLAVAYAPNALGQATRAGDFATDATYYPNGALKQFTYGNGIVHTLTRNVRGLPDRSRDAYGAVAVHDDSFTYDPNGNVAAISDGLPGHEGDRTMTYDGLDRLTKAVAPLMFGTADYGYDVLDNLVRVKIGGTATRDHSYFHDASNRLTNVINNVNGATVMALDYDVQGNLSQKDEQDYTFDFGNRLRAVVGVETYRYDGHGRRVQSHTPGGTNLLSHYARAGQLVYQYDQRQSRRTDFIHLAGSLVATRERPISAAVYTVQYQHTDALGSPVAVTNASAVVVKRSQYEPYGKLLNRPANDRPGYTGHVEDAATGLTYMQQRYYDPMIGRFLSVDPVTADGNTGGNFNRYWYANNNPYRFKDPDGRYSCNGSTGECATIKEYTSRVTEARDNLPEGSDEHSKLDRVVSYLGDHGEDNGVTITATTLEPGTTGSSSGSNEIKIDLKQVAAAGGEHHSVTGAGTVAHEVRHELDAADHGVPDTKAEVYRTELNAYSTTGAVGQGLGFDVGLSSPQEIQEAAEASTNEWCADGGGC